jgi:hypothetical protein
VGSPPSNYTADARLPGADSFPAALSLADGGLDGSTAKRTIAPMVKRKKSQGADDDLSEFVVDVASGDMPVDAVLRADKGANPAADALRRMGKAKGKRARAAPRQPRRARR